MIKVVAILFLSSAGLLVIDRTGSVASCWICQPDTAMEVFCLTAGEESGLRCLWRSPATWELKSSRLRRAKRRIRMSVFRRAMRTIVLPADHLLRAGDHRDAFHDAVGSAPGSSITGSPFVRAFESARIPFAAAIMNMVVITAALSSANTNLYLSHPNVFLVSRGERHLPRWLAQLSSEWRPASGSGGLPTQEWLAAILLAVFAPKNSFLLLYGTAVAGMFFVWVVILITHLRFRRRISSATLSALPLKLPFHPWPTLFAILAMCGIALSTFWVDGLTYTIPTFLPLLAVMSFVYVVYRSRRRKNL